MRRLTQADFLPEKWRKLVLGEEVSAPRGALLTLSDEDKSRHALIVGSIGSGKSKLLEELALTDIAFRVSGEKSHGLVFIDTHGDSATNIIHTLALLAKTYPEVYDNVVIIDPTISAYHVGFNPLKPFAGESAYSRASALTDAMLNLYNDDASIVVRLQQVLLHSFWALCLDGKTKTDFDRLVFDPGFREGVLSRVKVPALSNYFRFQFPGTREGKQSFDRQLVDWVGSSLNRLGRLIENPMFTPILSPKASTINFRTLMDEGKIVIVRVPKGAVKEQETYLFCALIVVAIQEASLTRQNIPKRSRTPMTVYADEFLNYANVSLIRFLGENRKFNTRLVLATQRISGVGYQEELLKAALDICQTLIAARVSVRDADLLVRDFFSPDLKTVKDTRTRIQHFGRLPIVSHDHTYYSLDELWEMARRQLTGLPDRHMWVKRKQREGVELVTTRFVPDAADRVTDQQLQAVLSRLHEEVARRYAWDFDVPVEPDDPKPYSEPSGNRKGLPAPKRSINDEFGENT